MSARKKTSAPVCPWSLIHPALAGARALQTGEVPAGFYCYAYVIGTVPVYVGKGTGPRCWAHARWCEEGKSAADYGNPTFMAALIDADIEPVVLVLREGFAHEAACELEKAIIKAIGKRIDGTGPLLNVLDGGDGFTPEDAAAFGRKTGPANGRRSGRLTVERGTGIHVPGAASQAGVAGGRATGRRNADAKLAASGNSNADRVRALRLYANGSTVEQARLSFTGEPTTRQSLILALDELLWPLTWVEVTPTERSAIRKRRLVERKAPFDSEATYDKWRAAFVVTKREKNAARMARARVEGRTWGQRNPEALRDIKRRGEHKRYTRKRAERDAQHAAEGQQP
ncbi:hypothetical protein [Roseomonas sp. CECT 9278]|uniref:hypothetical protein n=1 Tax=Roseomonas sp. CECT 9278 TaxID=2845823 RepID=UPI001E618344|nr:hypothetical protein [Roseomonas sp. CECT 9278]CAH0169545.1 hypothetical protein ROS9278_01161 [Roseomonas sp. CECT 9278]